MLAAFWVKDDDATVEEIESNGDALVVLYAVPVVGMAVDILKDHHRLFVTFLEQTVVISLDRHEGHIDIGCLIYNDGLTTTGLEILTIAQPVNNSRWLSFVD